jgi:outer membrane lipoprotein-sorting protein
MKKNFLFLSVLLACSLTGFAQDDARIISLDPTLYYSFEKDDYKTPTVGATPLEYYKMGDDKTIGTPWVEGDPQPTPASGPTSTKKAVTIPTELYLKVTNPFPVEGGVSEFTLLWDIRCADFSNFHTLLQSRVANDNDRVFFVNKSGALGHSTYSSFRMNVDAYYRVVLVATEGKYNIYVDGDLKLSYDHSTVTLQDFFWIFTDDDKECIDIDCANLAFWNTVLTPEDIAALVEVAPYTGTAYEGVPQVIPGLVEAEYFDAGGFGVAYYVVDQEAGGANNSIRQEESIPIRYDDSYSDYIILKNKDWAVYTIDVTKTETYFFQFATTGLQAEGQLTILLDNKTFGVIDVHPSEDWNYRVVLS